MKISFLSLFIGFRFSRERYCHSMVSMISKISTLGITLSVAVQIIGLSAINGFEKELKNRILSVVAHGEIEPLKQPWKNWLQALQSIEKVKGVDAVAPYVNFTGLIENGVNLCVIQIKGVDPLREEKLSALPRFVQNFAWKNFSQDKKQIILGKGVSDLLHAKIGDWISIMISNTGSNYKLKQLKQIRLQVSGILYLNSQIDYNFAMVPLQDACSYLEIDNSITGVALKVNDIFNAKKIAYNAGKILEKNVYIKSWIDTYGYMHHDIQMIRSIMNVAIFLIIGIAHFNIISTLLVAVKDKNSDIAIFRTMGAKDDFIRAIFIWYGFLIGVKGSLFGVVIGTVVSLNLTEIIRNIEKFINHQFLPGSIYFINFLPSKVELLDIVHVMLITLLLSLIASWYPSYRTNRINLARELNR